MSAARRLQILMIEELLVERNLPLLRIAASIFLAVLLGSCSQEGKQPSSLSVVPVYDDKFSPEEMAMAQKAFPIFCQTCQPLMGEYAADIEWIEITHGIDRLEGEGLPNNGCMDYRCDDYGWDKEIYIKVKIKDRTEVIPKEVRAFGHTLHFYLGGPVNPGITTTKFPELCGVQSNITGSDTYISVPSLSFIKK